MEAFIMDNNQKLRHYHIHDGLGRLDHLVLGTGEIDLDKRINLANKLNCKCVVETMEIRLESLDSLLNNMVKVYCVLGKHFKNMNVTIQSADNADK